LKAFAAHVPVIVISGTLDIAGKLQTLQGPCSASYVIEKPVDIDHLERTVRTALDHCGLDEAVQTLRSLERAEMIEDGDRERLFTERLARQVELLKRFHVDRKTIRRDLRDLVQRGQLDPSVCSNGTSDEA
jgi:FixJ family two-component response regulator